MCSASGGLVEILTRNSWVGSSSRAVSVEADITVEKGPGVGVREAADIGMNYWRFDDHYPGGLYGTAGRLSCGGNGEQQEDAMFLDWSPQCS